MYYSSQYGVMTSNVCGYGNHTACDNVDCACPCHPATKPSEKDEEVEYPLQDEDNDTKIDFGKYTAS